MEGQHQPRSRQRPHPSRGRTPRPQQRGRNDYATHRVGVGETKSACPDAVTRPRGDSPAFICVAVSRQELADLFDGKTIDSKIGFTPNQALLDAVDIDESGGEEAERAALMMASIYALTRYGERLVMTGTLPRTSLTESAEECHNGAVRLASVNLTGMESWFDDELPQLARQAASLTLGDSIDDAWNKPIVQKLMEESDLLWHDITERL